MNRIQMGAVVVLVGVAIGAGVIGARERSAVGQVGTAYADVMRRQAETVTEIARLEMRMQEQAARADAIEAENAAVRERLARAENAKMAAAKKTPPLTRQAMEARVRAARESVGGRNPAEALRELLWCLDEGMADGNSATPPLFQGILMDGLRELAETYPPARQELQTRRDAVRRRILANAGGRDFVPEYAAILRALKEEPAMLSLLDELPAGDRRRSAVAIYGSAQLIEARRYAEVLEGTPAASFFSKLEIQGRLAPMIRPDPNGGPSSLAKSAAKDVEVLAGSGDLANARELAKRFLAIDSSESARALLQERAERAGHPELFPTPKP